MRREFRSQTAFLVAQVALLLFFLLQLAARQVPQFHPDLIDGVRGLLLGVAIGLLGLTAWRSGQGRA